MSSNDTRLGDLLAEQDAFEREMGWSTAAHIAAAPGTEQGLVRQGELEYALDKLSEEMLELGGLGGACGGMHFFHRKRDRIADRPRVTNTQFPRKGVPAPTWDQYCDEHDIEDRYTVGPLSVNNEDVAAYLETVEEDIDRAIGYEAADTLFLLKKVGDALDGELAGYVAAELAERQHATLDGAELSVSRSRLPGHELPHTITDVLAGAGADDDPATLAAVLDARYDVPHREPPAFEEKSDRGRAFAMAEIADRMGRTLHGEHARDAYEQEVDDPNLYDLVFKAAYEARMDGTYTAVLDERIGREVADLTLSLLDITEGLERPFASYVEEKLDYNRERAAQGVDFGTDGAYGIVSSSRVPAYRRDMDGYEPSTAVDRIT